MKTTSIDLYRYDELPEEVQESVFDKYYETYASDMAQMEWYDFNESLERFCDICDIVFLEAEHGHIRWREKNEADYYNSIRGKYVRRWYNNNLYDNCIEPVIFFSPKYGSMRKRVSKILYTSEDCPWTGIYYDTEFISRIHTIMDKPLKDDYSLRDFLTEVLDNTYQFYRDCVDEYYTKEYFEERVSEEGECFTKEGQWLNI